MKVLSKKGTTMVEVIVAFAVLILIMAIFSQAVGLTGRMMNRADDTLEDYRSLAGKYYLDELTPVKKQVSLQFKEIKKGSVFEIIAIQQEFRNDTGTLYDVVPVIVE